MSEKFTQAFLREVKGKDAKGRQVHKAWKGVLKYKETNPDFKPKPIGEDTRRPSEKRAEIWRQLSKTFGPEIRTKTQANVALQSWRAEMEAKAEAISLGNVTVRAFLEEFISTAETIGIDSGRGSVRPIERSTARDYRTTANRICKQFGDVLLCDLDGMQFRTWEVDQRKLGASDTVVVKAHRLMKQACAHAVRTGKLVANPLEGMGIPARRSERPNALDAKGAQKLTAILAVADATPLSVGAMLALHCGLRIGECCGLRWQDVNLEAHEITVQQTVGLGDGGAYLKQPKSGRSRTVPTDGHTALEEALRNRRTLMMAQCIEEGLPAGGAEFGRLFVLGDVHGRFKHPTLLSREWANLSNTFGLTGTQGKRVTFHDLRHSYATIAITSGADISNVSSNLGHAKVSTTLDVYTSDDVEGKRRAARLSGAAMEPVEGQLIDFAPSGTEG